MKLPFLVVLLFLCLSAFSHAESDFELNLAKDLVTGGAALGLFVPSLFAKGEAGVMPSQAQINAIDRGLMYEFNSGLDTAGTIAAYIALALPAISLFGQDTCWTPVLTFAVMYAEAFMLTSGTKDLLKAGISRYRPYVYFGGVPAGQENDYYDSFPSGHTAFAFLGATFLAVTFALEYPDSPWKIPVIAAGYTIATGVGIFRIASGCHFLTDVLAGAAVGSLFGGLVPVIHLKAGKRETEVAPVLYADGLGLMLSIRR